MSSVSPRRPAALLRAALVAAVVVVPIALAADLTDRPPPVPVFVDGTLALVPHHATLGIAIRWLGLRAEPGRLLDIHGGVLDAHADPGRIVLNGRGAPRSTALSNGDRIDVVDGTDRTEGIRTTRVLLPGRAPGDPMFSLAISKVLQITRTGRVSGEVASVRYRSVGPSHRPPKVALTFDDGPWPGSTQKILSVLQRMHVRATFFLVGYLIERYPAIVQAEIRAGMTIGDHSWSHPYRTPFRDLSRQRIRTEIVKPARLLADRFGVRARLFRTPGGAYDQHVVQVARTAGMRVVQWSVDPKDYRDSATPRRIARSVLSGVRPGAIVLMHDGGGDQGATVKALPKIVRGIRRMGLKLVAIPTTRLPG
jgi:peptidoglycan/xylan/chitin deacetylase (PgdA/CDA1 family)